MKLSALKKLVLALVIVCASAQASYSKEPAYSPYASSAYPTQVYWGDTHLHTNLSLDANLVGGNASLTPDHAYRLARGETVTAHNGMQVKLRRPLDFLVVTDHAEYLGALAALAQRDPVLLSTKTGKRWASLIDDNPSAVAIELMHSMGTDTDIFEGDIFERSMWERVIDNAERYNEPGKFTAFIGYEYTSFPGGSNLHRNVIFRDGKERTSQVMPFSAIDSENPEDLWQHLTDYEKRTGGSVLAIPHNSNLSGGLMFKTEDSDGNPFTEKYASQRAYFEPIVEVTQYKGDSETHPYLSPEDEFADFERWDNANIGKNVHQDEWFQYEYIRSALQLGLDFQADIGVNPYRFGLIGSTDAHTALPTAEEGDFWGKFSKSEPSATRWKMPLHNPDDQVPGYEVAELYQWQMAASGYAAVWATDNTREAIFDAMRRRETYATTGPRLTVRFFGGFEFTNDDADTPNLAALGYSKGVPMGSELSQAPKSTAPSFLVSALKDPDGANIDRVQIIKGWRESDGSLKEKVYDVALSDGRTPDKKTGKVPPIGSTVDLSNATYLNSIGEPALTTVWTDPNFDPKVHAFYYARVIEIPKPRWTSYDKARLGAELNESVPKTVQDRAYTSPIWYSPQQ